MTRQAPTAETTEEMEERLRVWEQRLQRWEQELRHKSSQMRTEAALESLQSLRLPLESRGELSGSLLGEKEAFQRVAEKLRVVEALRSDDSALVASNASTNSQTPRNTNSLGATVDAAGENSPVIAPSSAERNGSSDPILEEASAPTTPRGRTPSETACSTPELPVRELPAELSAHAADFFSRHLASSTSGGLPSPTSPGADFVAGSPVEHMQCHGQPDGSLGSCSSPMVAMQPAPMQPVVGDTRPLSHQDPTTPTAAVHFVQLPPPQQAPANSPFWYRVAFLGGICVREAPDAVAPSTGMTLPCNEVFGVTERLQGVDHRVYLRLATGQGWVFDDSALFPDDPAVMEIPPQATAPVPRTVAAAAAPLQPLNNATGTSSGSGAAAPPVLSTTPGGPSSDSPMLAATPGAMMGNAPTLPVAGVESGARQGPTLLYSPDASPSHGMARQAPPPVAITGETNSAPIFVDSAATYGPAAEPAIAWYRVSFLGGVSIREFPDVDAPRTGLTLPLGEVFGVAERIMGNDQRIYLRLADGRGWAFDDSMLTGPDDSSVVLIQSPPAHMPHVYENGSPSTAMSMPFEHRYVEAYDYDRQWHHYTSGMDYGQGGRPKQYWARGCRGGAKRNKWKKEAARILAEKGVHVEVSSTSSVHSGNEDGQQRKSDDELPATGHQSD